WMGAAKEEYRGPRVGAMVVPGTYTVRMTLDGRSLTQNVVVKPDPRDDFTQAQYQAGYDFTKKYVDEYGQIDRVLNNMDAIRKSLDAAAAYASKNGNSSLSSQVSAAQQTWQDVFSTFTADYHNDEDSIQRSGELRESIPRGGFPLQQLPPTAAELDYAKRFDAAYQAAFAKYDDFVKSLGSLQTALKDAGHPLQGVEPVTP
ncbi:MAG TPA: hypothetical protein VMF61_06940, partial [Candidatus Acidoferrales bacterium]|nr:hypothetical protein [Candidatus Acidoferrales bacterium]